MWQFWKHSRRRIWSVSILIELVQLTSLAKRYSSRQTILKFPTRLNFFSAQPSAPLFALQFGFLCLGKAKAQTPGQKASEWALWTEGSHLPREVILLLYEPVDIPLTGLMSMRRSPDNLATANTNNKVMVIDRSRQTLIVRVGLCGPR